MMVQEGVPNHLQSTILFAEDNDDLRDVTGYFLNKMGYSVVACSDGALALKAFSSRTSIDILLTDLEMPVRSGVELARELTALRPSLPVVIVSGSIISDELRREMKVQKWMILSKPFMLPELLASIEFALRSNETVAA